MKGYNSRAVQKYLQTERTDKTMSKTTTKRFMGLLLALVMVFTMLPLSALAANDPEPPIPGDHPATPGEVKTYKTATPVDGKVNVFDVTLRMEAKAKEGESSDIVLVIDRSGSMGGNRIKKAKEAACAFADTLLADGDQSKTSIALISYASPGDVTEDIGFTKDKEALKQKINALSAGGNTNTGEAITRAHELAKTGQSKKKYIVLLSDGAPTDGPDAGINAAAAAKKDGIVIYSIGLETNTTTFNYLSQIANPGNAYEANPQNLQTVFQQIAGSIGSPIQEIKVTDVLGKGFKLVDTNLKPTAGTATYTDANRTITWTAPGLKPLQGQDGLFYAELKYQVTPTDEILNTTKGPNGYYTNESASMTYKDGDTPGTKDFPKPAVDVLLVKLLKEFNAGPNDNRTFTVKVTPAGGQEKDYVLTPHKRFAKFKPCSHTADKSCAH